jgi:uroporphyrinogen decarboxylase
MVFAKGVHDHWAELAATGARVLGVDSGIRLGEVARQVPASVALQGNLEPTLLVSATPEEISVHTRQVLAELRGRPGHIFNLGHGVLPEARLENIASVLATVRERI